MNHLFTHGESSLYSLISLLSILSRRRRRLFNSLHSLAKGFDARSNRRNVRTGLHATLQFENTTKKKGIPLFVCLFVCLVFSRALLVSGRQVGAVSGRQHERARLVARSRHSCRSVSHRQPHASSPRNQRKARPGASAFGHPAVSSVSNRTNTTTQHSHSSPMLKLLVHPIIKRESAKQTSHQS